jgi:hypothetical protein
MLPLSAQRMIVMEVEPFLIVCFDANLMPWAWIGGLNFSQNQPPGKLLCRELFLGERKKSNRKD